MKPESPGTLWCENFDLDLPKIIPGAFAALGDTAQWELFTECAHLTNGRINCPAAWNSGRGLASYFGFMGDPIPSGHVHASMPVPCTFWEAIRDLWIHQHLLFVGKDEVWNPSFSSPVGRAFELLMFHSRRWKISPENEVNQAKENVLSSLRGARDRILYARAKYDASAKARAIGEAR